MNPQSGSSRFQFGLFSLILILLALGLRVANLYGIPIFSFLDEADHIVWAQRFAVGNPAYPFLMDGKFLLGVVLALFRINGPGALWLARCAIGLLSILSCAACISIGSAVHSRRAGLLAGLLYAVLPQALFFEKQVFADPLMAAFGLTAAAFAVRLVRRPNRIGIILTAVFLTAATLTKLNGLVYFAFPALAVLMLPSTSSARWQAIKNVAFSFLLSALFAGTLLVTLSSRLGQNDGSLFGGGVGFIGCPALICEGNLPQQLNDLSEFGINFLETIPLYYGWPVVLLALTALPLARPRRAVGFFALAALATLLVFAFTAKGYVPARYLSFLVGPVVILAAVAIFALADRLRSINLTLARVVPVAALGLVAIQPLPNTFAILTNFDQAQLASQDIPGYRAPALGAGVRAAALSLLPQTQTNPPPVILVSDIYEHIVGAYFDRTRIDVRGLNSATAIDIGNWLSNGQPIFVIGQPNSLANGLTLEKLGGYPSEEASTVALWRVTGTDSAIRDQIYRNVFIEPEKLTADFSALVASLPSDAPVTLFVYPPNHAAAITSLSAATRPNVTVIPIGDSWPLDVDAAETDMQNFSSDTSDLRVAFTEETKGDSQRRMESWLNKRLFRLDEGWFGPVRLLSFIGDGQVTQSILVDAVFGDGITLESVEIIDSVSRPGKPIRVRLNWRASTPVYGQYKVFVHIFNGDFIIAQHDGQPVGELRPTNTWTRGETIRDQFAIRLPPDLAPGDYQLRIGMYDISSLSRLPVTVPGGGTGDFWVGGDITIQ